MIEIIGVINSTTINQDAITIFVLSNGITRYIVCPKKPLKRLTKGFLAKVLFLGTPNEQQLGFPASREELIKLIKEEGDIIYSYDI